MKIKTLFILLSLLLGSATAAWAQKFNVKTNGVNYTYQVLNKKKMTVALVHVPRDVEEIVVPGKVTYKKKEYTVSHIGSGSMWLHYSASLRSLSTINSSPDFVKVVLNEGVEVINSMAFYNCSMLEEVVLPKSIKSIGPTSFQGCTQLDLRKLDEQYFAITNNHIDPYQSYPAVPASAMAAADPRAQGAASAPAVAAPAPSSDVDIDIPTNKAENTNTFALIIANENYQNVSSVQYALNDGSTFKEYCNKTLGIPADQIEIYKDATYGNMASAWRWIENMSEAVGDQANYIIYYAGHGIPDEATGDAYLLPVDGDGSNYESGHSLKKLYSRLGDIKAKNVFVFLDACFSGSQRGEGMLTAARGVAIKAKESTPMGNMIVFSAAQGDETAYPYKDKEHGLFTYFLLKKLKESNGNVNAGELSDFIQSEVKRRAMISNKKPQTPSVSVSTSLSNDWKSLKLGK